MPLAKSEILILNQIFWYLPEFLLWNQKIWQVSENLIDIRKIWYLVSPGTQAFRTELNRPGWLRSGRAPAVVRAANSEEIMDVPALITLTPTWAYTARTWAYTAIVGAEYAHPPLSLYGLPLSLYGWRRSIIN